MRKFGFVVAALMAVLMMGSGPADAAKRTKIVVTPAPWYASWWWGNWANAPWTVRDPKLAASNFWVGAGSTAFWWGVRRDGTYWNGRYYANRGTGVHGATGAFLASSAACAAVSPIVGTMIVQRELTQREVFVSTANCFVPILGGWAMNNWFDYYGWDRPKKKR